MDYHTNPGLIAHNDDTFQTDCNEYGIQTRRALRDPFDFEHERELFEKMLTSVDKALALPAEQRRENIKKYQKAVSGLKKRLNALVREWEDTAAELRVLQYAEQLENVQPAPSTKNIWVDTLTKEKQREFIMEKSISNNAFSGYIRIEKPDFRGRLTVFYLITSMPVPGIRNKTRILKSMDRHFTSEEEAVKYANGRVEWMNKVFFPAVNPVIPKEYRREFLFHGHELPGFQYE